MPEVIPREMQIAYPWQIDGRGRVAEAAEAAHVRQMIEQVLFTIPGERVNRPDFGCGLQQLIFDPNSDELAATTEFLIQGSLQQWLGERITVDAVQVNNERADEGRLEITIRYVLLRTQEIQTETFSRSLR